MNRWTVIRTSNAYVFTDPKAAEIGHFRSKSENPTGTPNQDRDAVASRDRQLAALKATMA
jgi:hypothetical protein